VLSEGLAQAVLAVEGNAWKERAYLPLSFFVKTKFLLKGASPFSFDPSSKTPTTSSPQKPPKFQSLLLSFSPSYLLF
jgi:hypothetical protein